LPSNDENPHAAAFGETIDGVFVREDGFVALHCFGVPVEKEGSRAEVSRKVYRLGQVTLLKLLLRTHVENYSHVLVIV